MRPFCKSGLDLICKRRILMEELKKKYAEEQAQSGNTQNAEVVSQ
jgi:hypothetical protein